MQEHHLRVLAFWQQLQPYFCETLVNAMLKMNYGHSACNIAIVTHVVCYLIYGQSARSQAESLSL